MRFVTAFLVGLLCVSVPSTTAISSRHFNDIRHFNRGAGMLTAESELESDASISTSISARADAAMDSALERVERAIALMEIFQAAKQTATTDVEWASVNAAWAAVAAASNLYSVHDFWYINTENKVQEAGPELVAVFPSDGSATDGKKQLEIHIHCPMDEKSNIHCKANGGSARFYDRRNHDKYEINPSEKANRIRLAIIHYASSFGNGVSGTQTINKDGNGKIMSFTNPTLDAGAPSCGKWNTKDHHTFLVNNYQSKICIFGAIPTTHTLGLGGAGGSGHGYQDVEQRQDLGITKK